jgi:PLP dependent protein
VEQTEIRENYEKVLERIDGAAQRTGRNASQIRLVVVTKTHSTEVIQSLIELGVCHLGESYIEEAIPKIEVIKKTSSAPSMGLEWHMIGHVQSRKARFVCENFDYLHSLDRPKLAKLLDRAAATSKRKMPVLVEFNVSGEGSKFGFPAWEEENWPLLIEPLEDITAYAHLDVRGLMTMAPFGDDPELARPFFSKLRRLRDFLQDRLPQTRWEELSMGMSSDFEVAVEEGATWIRVGSAILGER